MFANLHSEINFQISNKSIIINVSNLKNLHNELLKFALLDTNNNLIGLSFNIALPENFNFKTDYKIHSYQTNYKQIVSEQNSPLQVSFTGIRRGISIHNIKFSPMFKNNGETQVANNFTLYIEFEKEIPLLNSERSDYEKEFFADIINKQHLPFIIKNLKRNKLNQNNLQSKNWYNPSIKYLKIETNDFNIVQIKGSDIFQFAPEWYGLPISGFHLIFNGRDYPIYIESSSELIDEQTKIYFLGRHALGDTTYLDNYTDKAVFYLFFDIKKEPTRLSIWPQVLNTTKINSVDINYHIEYDKEYFGGTNDIYSRTDYLEGWYWAKLHRFKEPWEEQLYGFKHYLPILPSENDSLSISYNFATLNISLPGIGLEYIGKDPRQKYFFHTIFNKDTVATTFVDKWTDSLVSFSLDGSNFMSGLNEIKVLNRRIDSSNGMLGINYIQIQGKAKPFVQNGFTKFNLNNVIANSEITIPGFNSRNIIAIDTTNNQILFTQGIEGYRFAASVSSNSGTFIINDSSFYFDNSFIFAYKAINDVIKFISFTDNINTNQVINIYNQLPSGSLILFMYNLNRQLPIELRNFLQSIGSSQISNLSSDMRWVFATLKGSSVKHEKISNKIASIDGFYEQNGAGSYQAKLLFQSNKNYSLFVNSDLSLQNLLISNVNPSDLRNTEQNAELIIISHNKFLSKAREYAQYKVSKGISAVVIDVEDIYKEYSYGKKTPHAIKQFLKFAYSNWTRKPKYLLLIGDASWDSRKLLKNSKSENFIPSYGWPVSDNWYGLLEGDDMEPEILVGRIPAQNITELENYIEKVKTFENQPNAPWMKKFLYLSGGDGELQRRSFASYRYNIFDKVEPYPICAETAWVGLRNFNAGSEEQKNEILSHLNAGTIWTFFFGHASSQVFDLDGWQVEYMNNKGRCGFLATLSCNAGAFAEPLELHSRNEAYILAKDNGFVIAYGTSGVGMVEGALALMTYMVDGVADTRFALRRAGDILLYGKSKLDPSQWVYYVTRDLVNILGDPTVSLRLGIEPDLFLTNDDLNITNELKNDKISEDNKYAIISGKIYNNGYATNYPFSIQLIRRYKNQVDTLYQYFNSICNSVNYNFKLPVENLSGQHYIELYVSSNAFSDKNYADNLLSTSFYVYSQNLVPIDPQANWNVNSKNPIFRFINPINLSTVNYTIEILKINEKDTLLIAKSDKTNLILDEGYLDWTPSIQLEQNQAYVLRYKIDNPETGASGYFSYLPFYTDATNNNTKLRFASNSDYSNFEFNGIEAKDNKLQIDNPVIEFSLTGVNGRPTGEFDSWVNITLGNDVYVEHRYFRGFNVVVVPKNQKQPKGRYYRFDTWEYPDDARALVRLLRDSVSVDDYVLIATCNQSFRAFEELVPRTDFAYIDSLRLIFSEVYQSKLADKLSSNKSFVYVGGKKAQNIWEDIQDFDTATVSGKLIFYSMDGTASYEIPSPSKKWYALKVVSHTNNVETLLRFSTPDRKQFIDTIILGSGLIDISKIPANKFPYLNLNFRIYKSHYLENPTIDTISLDFEPTEELLMMSTSRFINQNILRGDTAILQLTYKNLSLRSDASNLLVKVNVKDSRTQESSFSFEIPNIQKNTTETTNVLIPTEKFIADVNVVPLIISPNAEKFVFNNSCLLNFKTYEDTLKPWIIARINDKIIRDGDFISSQPTIKIELYDNSLLPVVRSNDIQIRLNGVMQTPERTNYYKLENYAFNRPLKATLTIIPDTLKEEYNSMLVYFSDASSNRDTVKFILKIAKNGKILDNITYPNPSKYSTNLKFYLISPENNQKFTLNIYNSYGQRVRQLEIKATIGDNSIILDNTDDFGNLLPNGIYYYSITAQGEIYFEPKFGKFIVNY